MTYDRSGSAKWILTEQDITELVLVICDEHLLEDEGLFSSEHLMQMILVTQTAHSGLMRTVDLLFLESIGLQSGPRVLRQKDSTPLGVFMRFFFEILRLLVEETNRCHQYLDT